MIAALFTLGFGIPAGIALSVILAILWWVAINEIHRSPPI